VQDYSGMFEHLLNREKAVQFEYYQKRRSLFNEGDPLRFFDIQGVAFQSEFALCCDLFFGEGNDDS
jgi:hypothetical protein